MICEKRTKSLLTWVHASGIALFTGLLAWQVAAQQARSEGIPDVVSIGGSVTEIIYALGQEHRILARDTTSTYPEAALELPDVGYIRSLSPEGVLSVGPQLIIAEDGAGPAEVVDVLRAASVDFVGIPDAYSMDGVLNKIRAVGAALNATAKAEEVIEKVQQNMDSVLAAIRDKNAPQKRVLFILSTQGGRIMASGTDTAADAIIELAGGVNALEGFTGYKPVTNEAITAAAPDVVLMMKRREGHDTPDQELWAMPALAETPAHKAGAVVRIDGLLLLGFGPRTPHAVWALHKSLLGEQG